MGVGMPTGWYYARDVLQAGPVSAEEIRRRLTADGFPVDALVWREGLETWQKPEDFPEFLRKSNSASPPLPIRPPTAPPAETLLPEKRKSVWLTAITTREQAFKVIKGAGIAFFVIAALLIPLGIFLLIVGWGLDFVIARALE